jgi:hypothetical protein
MGCENAVVIPKICNAVLKSYQNSWPRDLVQIYICSPLDFHAQTMNWDCGYRNMQSMLSSYLNHDSIIRDQLFTAGILINTNIIRSSKKNRKCMVKRF